MKLTVLFNGQFWEGIVECDREGCLKVARHLFGAEPRDIEVLEFVVNNTALQLLEQITTTVETSPTDDRRVNPKRRARQAARETASQGISSHAQLALQQEFELRQQAAKRLSRAAEEAEQEEKYKLMRQKAKERHRGKA
jgi:hypothetical protein